MNCKACLVFVNKYPSCQLILFLLLFMHLYSWPILLAIVKNKQSLQFYRSLNFNIKKESHEKNPTLPVNYFITGIYCL